MAKSTINPTVYNQLYRNQVNRAEQTRQDDDYIKIPEITIYDVDYSILHYIRHSIKPEVQDKDRMIDVPVMYGSGELWSQIQSNGFMRDEKNKLLCPVITLSRTRMEEYKDFAKLDVNNRVSSRVYYRQGYTQNNARYGSNNRGSTDLPQKEIYITLIPEYYYVYYDLNIWTDFNEQLNKIVEMFIPVNNFVWGNDYQFVTNIEDFSFSTVNISKQERIVKASTRLRVLATLMPAFVERKSSIQKALSIKKVSVAERVINNQNIVESQPSRVRVFSRIALQANLNSFSTLTGGINFVQKPEASLLTSSSVTGNISIPKLVQASLTGAGTTAANLTVNAPSAGLLLDTYPNAAAAYSLRKLRTAYTGSAIRVRRSLDNTEQDIGFDINGNLDTTALTTFVGAGNGFVTTWYDQSGNAKDATQSSATNQPQIVSSGVVILESSKPVLNFDGQNSNLLNNTINITQPITRFTVGKSINTNTKAGVFMDSNTLNDRFVLIKGFPNDNPGKFVTQYSATFQPLAIDFNSIRNLFYELANNGSNAFSINNNTETIGNNGTGSLIGLRIGRLRTEIIPSLYQLSGNIQEIIIYPSNQSGNKAGIQLNINSYYAIY